MKANGLKPYKIHISHGLQEGDAQRRLNFCYWLQNQIDADNNFLSSVIWSDEATFTNCGYFNRNNEHIWAVANPRENREIRRQVRFSINVWAGMLGDKLFGSIFFTKQADRGRISLFPKQ